MRTGINLPVIEQLTVSNYSLYPGTDGSGLDVTFADGVTVIAGINGVGKTTLLTLISRMLLGPTDPMKAGASIGRVSERDLVTLDKYDFFSSRVPEVLGDDSTATLRFQLGGEEVCITRLMRDLKIKHVTFSGRSFTPSSESAMVEELARRAGLLSAYDFHVVIRNLQFFSEDRPPLLWDPGSQFELYKILFFDEDIAESLNAAFAEVQSLDTDHRNRRHQLNKRRALLPASGKTSGAIEIESLDRLIRGAQEKFDLANTDHANKQLRLDALITELRSLDVQADEAQVELGELEQEFSQQDAMFILQALPTLGDKERFLMQGFATGCGCFICGSKSKNNVGTIRQKTSSGHCFVCDGPIHSADTSNVTPITALAVVATEEKIDALQISVANIDAQRDKVQLEMDVVLAMVRTASNTRMESLRELDKLNALRPKTSDRPYTPQDEIDREARALEVIAAEIKSHTAKYRSVLAEAESRMDGVKEDLRRRLTEYATAFLQEKVSVNFNGEAPFKLATGAEVIKIPSFTINMTSSTHRVEHERRTSSSVSESQKEFLDLAFRMSLLDVVSNEGSTMLVIETPEASLDSWFMRRAADLMRRFASETDNRGRKMIATSNINGTVMIPALLGLVNEDGSMEKLPRDREHYLVNLLRLTPASAALREAKASSLLDEELGRYLHDW